jgi:hypothetical protein
MAEVVELNPKPRTVRAEDLVSEVASLMAEQSISGIYRDRIRTMRTRKVELNAPTKKAPVEILHTLLGIELKIGKRRLLCPDLSTARYLSVFARLGLAEIAVPYDITQLSRLADELESAWFRMMTLIEHLTTGRGERLRNRVQSRSIASERDLVAALGAGPAIPQFNQNTKQRRTKS